jgi:hypothetical protein
MMKNILKPGTYPDNDKDFLPSEGESDVASKSVSSRKSFSSDSDEDKHKKHNIENEYDKQLKEINTEQIMEEFSKLFQMSYTQSTTVSLNPKVSLQGNKKKRSSKRSSTLLPSVQKLDNDEHKEKEVNEGSTMSMKRGKMKMRTQKLKNVEMKSFNENKVLLGKKVFEEDKTKCKHVDNEDMVFEGKLSAGHAKALLIAEDEEYRLSLANLVVKEGLSVRDTERLARKGGAPATSGKKARKRNPYYDEVELALSDVLKRKVKVTKSNKKGALEIEFFDDDDLKKLLKIFDNE